MNKIDDDSIFVRDSNNNKHFNINKKNINYDLYENESYWVYFWTELYSIESYLHKLDKLFRRFFCIKQQQRKCFFCRTFNKFYSLLCFFLPSNLLIHGQHVYSKIKYPFNRLSLIFLFFIFFFLFHYWLKNYLMYDLVKDALEKQNFTKKIVFSCPEIGGDNKYALYDKYVKIQQFTNYYYHQLYATNPEKHYYMSRFQIKNFNLYHKQFEHDDEGGESKKHEFCPCRLLGHCLMRTPTDDFTLFTTNLDIDEYNTFHMYPLMAGGYWRPPKCIPDFVYFNMLVTLEEGKNSTFAAGTESFNLYYNKLVNYYYSNMDKLTIIVIPYLRRYDNLRELLYNLHPFLQRQFVHYRIVVAEQYNDDQPFNKGRIYNAAFNFLDKVFNKNNNDGLSDDLKIIGEKLSQTEDGKRLKFNCMILHDVDLIPENDYNIYECDQVAPRHLSLSIRNSDESGYYKNLYEVLIGGVLAIKPFVYRKINGFSNEYWLWGAEDDDLAMRMIAKDVCIKRPTDMVGLYKMARHNPSVQNPIRENVLFSSIKRMENDGVGNIDNLDVEIVDVKLYDLFTHIRVDVGKFDEKSYANKYSRKVL